MKAQPIRSLWQTINDFLAPYKLYRKTLPKRYFDLLYSKNTDPWHYTDIENGYEQRKYARTLSALPQEMYQSGLEIGCSVGALTTLLGNRCTSILGIDCSDIAIQQARNITQRQNHIKYDVMLLPKEYPTMCFDLIVMSEVGYYLSASDLEILKDKMINSLTSNGTIVLVHWINQFPINPLPLSGFQVHQAFKKDPRLSLKESREYEDANGKHKNKYFIDVLLKV